MRPSSSSSSSSRESVALFALRLCPRMDDGARYSPGQGESLSFAGSKESNQRKEPLIRPDFCLETGGADSGQMGRNDERPQTRQRRSVHRNARRAAVRAVRARGQAAEVLMRARTERLQARLWALSGSGDPAYSGTSGLSPKQDGQIEGSFLWLLSFEPAKESDSPRPGEYRAPSHKRGHTHHATAASEATERCTK